MLLTQQLQGKSDIHKIAEEVRRRPIQIIAFRMKDFSWTGEQSIIDAKCLAETNGGLYITADAEQELAEALAKTLGCPMLSRLER